MVRSRRLHITLGVSLLLHVVLLAWMWLREPLATHVAARPVELTVLVPPVVPREPPPRHPVAAPSKTRSDAASPHTELDSVQPSPAGVAVGAAPADEVEEPSTAGEAAPAIDIFAPGAVRLGARGGPHVQRESIGPPTGTELSGTALGQARLDAWAKQLAAKQRAQYASAPPAMVDLGKRLGDWFQPGDAAIEHAAPLGLGVASHLESSRSYYADIARRGFQNVDDPEGLRERDSKVDSNPDVEMFKFCFGQCTGQGHEVAMLAVTIQIDHDERGAAEAWRVVESSGDRSFDVSALSAVQEAKNWTDAALSKVPPLPRWTRWQLSQHAYRWGRGELMTDPLLTPPGQELERESGVLGKTTLTREVRLVAIEYRGTK